MNGPMLQALLEERLQLKIRRELREVPVYELTIAKGGPKLEPFQEGSCIRTDEREISAAEREPGSNYCDNAQTSGSASSPNGTFFRQRLTLDDFCRTILADLDRPVINKTGVTGLFNFHLQYAHTANEDEQLRRAADSTAIPQLRDQILAVIAQRANGPAPISIFSAVQQQLGLRLDPAKGPGEFIVIDSVSRPSEN